MQNQQQPTAAQQVKAITEQLNAAYARKQEAEDMVETEKKTIAALRNVLAGLQLGMQLQKEIDAEQQQQQQKSAPE